MTTAVSSIVIIFNPGDEFLLDVAVDALAAKRQDIEVLGVPVDFSDRERSRRDNFRSPLGQRRRIIINTRQVQYSNPRDDEMTDEEDFDYEYLYSRKHFIRRDFVRFLAFVLGQYHPNNDIVVKSRSTFLSLTFPDINDAFPNLQIVSVGVDALEFRVDLLQEESVPQRLPRLHYIAQQFLALRRRTELPIIFTIRFNDSAGKWPLSEDQFAQTCLRKALKWGVEYIDVPTSFSEEIKADLVSKKGSTLIIASHHDLNGGLHWASPEIDRLFDRCCQYGDIIEMVGLATCQKDNYDLGHFRSRKCNSPTCPPLIAINTGLDGRFSRITNSFLNPIKHHLLPHAASPSQLSVAEINRGLEILGEISTSALYTFSYVFSHTTPPPEFFEKCLNELSLPHLYTYLENPSEAAVSNALNSANFGGAITSPSIKATASIFATVTPAAMATGLVDTITIKDGKLCGHNIATRGILLTLTRDFVPSAYANQCALVVSHSFAAAASALYVLQVLQCRKIYTIGFTIPENSPLTRFTQNCQSLPLKEDEAPFAIISALPKSETQLLSPLFRLLGSPEGQHGIFLDVVNPIREEWVAKDNPESWIITDVEEVAAWTAVEMMKLLVGQNIPYDFVRIAGKEGLF